MRSILLGVLISLLSFFASGCASNPGEAKSHKVVQINNMNLAPKVVQVSGSADVKISFFHGDTARITEWFC